MLQTNWQRNRQAKPVCLWVSERWAAPIHKLFAIKQKLMKIMCLYIPYKTFSHLIRICSTGFVNRIQHNFSESSLCRGGLCTTFLSLPSSLLAFLALSTLVGPLEGNFNARTLLWRSFMVLNLIPPEVPPRKATRITIQGGFRVNLNKRNLVGAFSASLQWKCK